MGHRKKFDERDEFREAEGEGEGLLYVGGRRCIDNEESREILSRGIADGLKRPSELMKFVVCLTGAALPWKRVCEDHQTPWDMVRAIYFDEVQSGLGVGMRGGYKTTAMAALNAVELLTKPGIQIASMAAIELQAKRCYQMTVEFLSHPFLMGKGIFVKPPTLSETLLWNGSKHAQLGGTLNQVNGPRPNRLRVDEIELMDPRVLGELVMMPATYGGYKKSILYVSSRKNAAGNVQEMLDSRTSLPRWIFCWKDVVEKCPDSRSGIMPAKIDVEDIYLAGNRITFEGFEGCRKCALAPACQGVAKRAQGRYPIDDLISEYLESTREMWLAQKECRVVERRGLRYPEFDEGLNVGRYEYDPALPCDVTADFGASHATAILWVQEDGPDAYVVHEQFYRDKPSDFHSREAYEWTDENHIRIRDQIGDLQARQQMIDFNANPYCRGFWDLRGTRKPKTRDVWESEISRMIRDTAGKRHLYIDESCKNLIRELKTFRYKRTNSMETIEEGNDCLAALGYWRCHRLRKGAVTYITGEQKTGDNQFVPIRDPDSDPEIEEERARDQKDMNYSIRQEIHEFIYGED